MPSFPNIRIVLVGTTHPGNIGAAARAMKTMGMDQLYLVNPQRYPCAEATARASSANDLLARARVCATLDEALGDCSLVIGASARLRAMTWPQLDPRQSAALLLKESQHAHVALIFGREHSGLTNEELDRCQYLMHIPANPEYSSLNLAAAVQVATYEIMMESQAIKPTDAGSAAEDMNYASGEETEAFYIHLEETLVEIEFLDPTNPRQLMRRLRRLFNRVRLDRNEVNILRGILTAARNRKRTSPPA